MIVRCDSQYFFQRGLAFERLVNASHPQSFHPFSNSLVLDHRRRCPLHNKAADGFGYRQRFNNRQRVRDNRDPCNDRNRSRGKKQSRVSLQLRAS